MEIHSRKMQVSKKVNYGELARSTDEFNGAQLKAVCVEAGMIALREGSKVIGHEHFLSGVLEVQSKKKNDQVSCGAGPAALLVRVADLPALACSSTSLEPVAHTVCLSLQPRWLLVSIPCNDDAFVMYTPPSSDGGNWGGVGGASGGRAKASGGGGSGSESGADCGGESTDKT